MRNRSLPWLTRASSFVLTMADSVVRKKFIEIAATQMPSSAFDDATREAVLSDISSVAAAKATRWLAVIRRDYGQKVFDQIVAER
jgi:hypothetical protein